MRWPPGPTACGPLVCFALVFSCAFGGADAASAPDERGGAMKAKPRLELLGRLPRKPGGPVGHMALQGKHVYLVNEEAGLQAVDVSDPAAPKVVGSYRPKGSLGPVAASGVHVFVVEEDTLLRVLDVTNPARPRAVGSRELPAEIRGLAADGKHVYASTSDSLRVLDVSDPARPGEVGVCGGLELAGRVTVAGRYAYVAADFNGMRVIDVADPAKPKEVGSFEGPGNVTAIAVVGKVAHLADYSGGLHLVDVSNPKRPRRLGRHGDFVVGDVAVTGRYALLAAGALDVVDVSKPDRPREAGGFSGKDYDAAWSVAAAGELVYALSDAGLFVFRLTAPAGSR
jgi:hypothetical protein